MALYGVAGLLGALAFVSSLAILHAMRLEIDWMQHYVSEFANGPLASLFVFGATVHALGNLALSVGLRRSLAPATLGAAASVLLSLAAFGILAVVLFPIDPGGRVLSMSGHIHRLAAAASFLLEFLALVGFSVAFMASALWRRWASLSLAWSAVAAATVVGLALGVLWNRMPGLAERLALGSFLLWEVGVSLELLRSRARSVGSTLQ